jgi:Fe-S cluster biogenesis protein NfuA/nitrite reductase/ring-hydroxylating ferredoxin subunit
MAPESSAARDAPSEALRPDALPPEIDAAVDRIGELVAGFEGESDEDLQGRVFDLLRSIDTVHRAGLRRLDELLKAAGLQARAIDDPEVKLLFDLYDLGEGGDRQRAEAVIETVAPYIESHGGRITVLDAEGGVVRVQLAGACSGCQGSSATLRHVVEGALRDSLADFVRMEVEDAAGGHEHDGGHGHSGHDHGAGPGSLPPAPPAGFIPLESLRPVKPTLTWHPVFAASSVAVDTLRTVEVEGEAVLVANIAGEHYAYRDLCPGSPFSLGSARIEDGVLICPWHDCRFDVRGGRRMVGDGPGLTVVPIAIEGDEVRIGVLHRVAA